MHRILATTLPDRNYIFSISHKNHTIYQYILPLRVTEVELTLQRHWRKPRFLDIDFQIHRFRGLQRDHQLIPRTILTIEHKPRCGCVFKLDSHFSFSRVEGFASLDHEWYPVPSRCVDTKDDLCECRGLAVSGDGWIVEVPDISPTSINIENNKRYHNKRNENYCNSSTTNRKDFETF